MNSSFADELPVVPAGRSPDALLVASLLHLMSHYTAREAGEPPCVKLASVIERHLCALARLPDVDPVLRATCEQLVAAKLPVPGKTPLLARFMKGAWPGKAAAVAG